MIYAMVPMRSGSKSIPDKNIKDFLGKPLFAWNVEVLYQCLEQGIIDRLVINTDSKDYGRKVNDYMRDYYRPNIFIRCERTARDDAVNIDVAQEFIEKMNLEDNDVLLYVQVTSPYVTVEDVEQCINSVKLLGFGSAMTVVRDTGGFIINYDMGKARDTPRQEMSRLKTNGCIYSCTTAGTIRESAMLWDYPVYYHVQPYGFELDEPADWVYGEEVLRAHSDRL